MICNKCRINAVDPDFGIIHPNKTTWFCPIAKTDGSYRTIHEAGTMPPKDCMHRFEVLVAISQSIEDGGAEDA
jgi:hypothetical protein